jgi:CubicO group peptidase (beta-lactamase class C family)
MLDAMHRAPVHRPIAEPPPRSGAIGQDDRMAASGLVDGSRLTDKTLDAFAAHLAGVAERHHVPGIAAGIVFQGTLVHSMGLGELGDGRGQPDGQSLFRIASMTKSFTAAAVLHLRDAGRVRLDDPIAEYVPSWRGLRGPTRDSAAVTVRHLLTMQSGMATDDAWADRHLDVDRSTMESWFASGATFAYSPGEAFHYSNLGYGILGRLVTDVAGVPMTRYVTEELLEPLGMRHTVFEHTDAPAGTRVAVGHAWIDDAWVPEEPLADGGLGPMGGLWSTVEDLARWVAFFCDAFPPRDDDDHGPLSRATRREMQQISTPVMTSLTRASTDAPLRAGPTGYGMGLLTVYHLKLGTMTGHSGGLPGFGSNMRWLPQRGFGLVALGNLTYAPIAPATYDLMDLLDSHDAIPAARQPPASLLGDRAARLADLLSAWDDSVADELFADNVFLDSDRAHRRAAADELVARHGALTVRTVEPVSRTSGEAILAGERGQVRVDLQLSPQVPPRVQWYECTSLMPLDEHHVRVFEAIAAWTGGGGTFPLEFLAPDVDHDEIEHALAGLRAVAGPCRVGEVTSNEGGAKATVQLVGRRADADVAVTLVDGLVTKIEIKPRPIEPH